MMRIVPVFILSFFSVVLTAQGHYLWIELGAPAKLGTQQHVKVFYGEYNEGVREVKGGRLEEVAGIIAWIVTPDGKEIPLTLTIQEAFYEGNFVPQVEGKYTVVAVNTVREVVDWSKHDIGIVRPVYYAYKEVVVAGAVNEPVNVSPDALLRISAGKDKNSFVVLFKERPLAKAKVWFHAPNEWSKEFTSDEKGVVTCSPLWKGQYVVECIYSEKNPGSFKSKEYEAIRHRATLSVEIP